MARGERRSLCSEGPLMTFLLLDFATLGAKVSQLELDAAESAPPPRAKLRRASIDVH